MNELIEQIIHIQSLQMQQYTIDNLENGVVDLSEIISDIGQDVCFEFQHKDVHWQWQPPDASSSSHAKTMWTVQGNQEQLHSALENIVRNAFVILLDFINGQFECCTIRVLIRIAIDMPL